MSEERRLLMSETGLAASFATLMCIILAVACWKQIVAITLIAVAVVFCVGVYYIAAAVYP